MRWARTALLLIAMALAMPVAAQASSSQKITHNGGPLCTQWHFREFRDGLFASGLLWQITQDVSWCNDGYGHFNGKPNRSYGHKEGSTWAFGGWDSHTAEHKHNPNRWVFRISATEVGNASGIFNEHNYPYERLTVYPNSFQDTWAASCGCKGTITGPQR